MLNWFIVGRGRARAGLCRACALVLAVSCLSATASFGATIQVQTIALSRDPVAGVAGAGFLNFNTQSTINTPTLINNAGDVAFIGTFTGPGVTEANNQGLFLSTAGTTSLLLREGDQSPDGRTYGSPSNGFDLNDQGQVAIWNQYTGAGTSGVGVPDRALIKVSRTSEDVVLRTGDEVAGTKPFPSALGDVRVWRDDVRVDITDDGTVYTNIILLPEPRRGVAANNNGVLLKVAPDGTQSVVLRESDLLPEDPALEADETTSLEAAENGELAFVSKTRAIGSLNDSGAALVTRGALGDNILIRTGEVAPDTGGGIISEVTVSDVNESGEILVGLAYKTPGDPTTKRALYFVDARGFELLAKTGDPVPGDPTSVIGGSGLGGSLNNTGDVAFVVNIDNGLQQNGLLVRKRGGAVELLARSSDTIDRGNGMENTIRLIGTSISLNDNGLLVFQSDLFGPNVNGVFVADLRTDVTPPVTNIPLPASAWLFLSILFCAGVAMRRLGVKQRSPALNVGTGDLLF